MQHDINPKKVASALDRNAYMRFHDLAALAANGPGPRQRRGEGEWHRIAVALAT